MPFYNFKCTVCGNVTEELVKMGTDTITCKCGGTAEKQLSLKFNATGLPNGFSSTRSSSRK